MANKNQACTRTLLFLFAVALFLRVGGLSHDLQVDAVYHPDTPKQVNAVKEFLRGDYMVLHNHHDYDGYPYFNSHLVEYILRGSTALQTVWLKYTGAYTEPVAPPSTLQLFWIMRGWNAVMSALAVPLIFIIGLRFGKIAAWASAFFLLVSPLDINGCHYAANDTAAAFFALASLWFGLRIYEHGRFRDLLGGALCVGAAFSSKYHGAMGVLPVLLGLVLHCRNEGRLGSRYFLSRIVALFFMGIGAVAITSPGLLIYPERAFKDILGFFEYTANFALPESFKELSLPERMLVGWKANLPVLLGVISIPVAIGVAISVLGLFRDSRIWLVLSVPIIHLLFGITGKPHLHTVHHLPVVAYFFVASGIGFFSIRSHLPMIRKLIGIPAVAWAVVIFIPAAYQEIFFFQHNDTRRVVKEWAYNTIPASVPWNTGSYTFKPQKSDEENVLGLDVSVFSGNPPGISPDYKSWFTFSLEDNRLSIFRNRDLYVLMKDNDLLQPNTTVPFALPLPSESTDNLIPLDLPWLGRTPLACDVSRTHSRETDAITTQSLNRAWMVIRTGASAAYIEATFGKHANNVNLRAGQYVLWEIADPRSSINSSDKRFYYSWKVSARWGAARALLFTDAAQVGLWAFQQNDFDTAARLLRDETDRHPLYAAVYEIASQGSDRVLRDQLAETLSESWTSLFGISKAFLDELPYVSLTPDDWSNQSPQMYTNKESDIVLQGWFSSSVHVEAGHYQLHIDNGSATKWAILDSCGRIIQEGVTDAHTGRAALFIPAPSEPFYIQVEASDAPPESVALRPDPATAINNWIAWLKDGSLRPPQCSSYGADNTTLATFDNDIELINVEIDADTLTPGGILEYRMDWKLPDRISQPHRVAAWVHLDAEDGQTITQDDHILFASTVNILPDPRDPPCRRRIELPETLAPGTYTLKIGLWRPNHLRRIKVKESSFEHGRKEVFLKTFEASDSQ